MKLLKYTRAKRNNLYAEDNRGIEGVLVKEEKSYFILKLWVIAELEERKCKTKPEWIGMVISSQNGILFCVFKAS